MINDQNFELNDKYIQINRDKKNKIKIQGLISKPRPEASFDINYLTQCRNILISTRLNGKMEFGSQEIRFYYRVLDRKNFCRFSIKGGQYIKLSIMSQGQALLQTSWLKISDQNLFETKFNLVLSVFEDTTTVLIDETIILNYDHTPNLEGGMGIQFNSEKDEHFDLELEQFSISEEILNFDPIINFPKNPDVYFMLANDFYEQNRYDMALNYFEKGMLFGNADHKNCNRIGNLFFLIEEYEKAESYYQKALQEEKESLVYKINYVRSLIKQEKETEFSPFLEELLATAAQEKEFMLDYAQFLMTKNENTRALEILDKIKSKTDNDFGFQTKYGKCLLNLDRVDEGQPYLFKAARSLADSNPASSAIILKYSIDKKLDERSFVLLLQILIQEKNYQDVYEMIKQHQWEIQVKGTLLDYLILAEFELGLYEHLLTDLEKYHKNQLPLKLSYYQAFALFNSGSIVNANQLIDGLIKAVQCEAPGDEININHLIHLKLKIMSRPGQDREKNQTASTIKQLINLADQSNSSYDLVLEEYGKILVDLNQYEEAAQLLLTVIKKQPHNQEVLYNLGITYNYLQEYPEAKKYLKRLYQQVQNQEIIFQLCHTLFHTTDYQEALYIIHNYYQQIPDNSKLLNLIGNLNLALNNITEAQKFYYAALNIEPDNEEYGLNLAESFYKLKDYENAYMITNQINKKGVFDRAKSLHLRVKSHLFITLKCSCCQQEWSLKKTAAPADFPEDEIPDLPENAPAGICPRCQKIYCRKCVTGVPGVEAQCPECHELLEHSRESLKIIYHDIINKG